ncbi:recombinase family protein, partial [Frankia sp. Cpl3]|nr:recombinase family protein [Frankia sp. Cpl3]
MLSNRAYIGEFYQNRWNTEGMLGNRHKAPEERRPIQLRPIAEWIRLPCPVIVDEPTFAHAQLLLQESRRRWAGRSVHPYLLSGLVRCGDCANTMTGRKVNKWGKTVYHYTDRKNTLGSKQA